jgi:D-lactate dehydrogenase
MRVAVFSTHSFDRRFLDEANTPPRHEFRYLEPRLGPATCALAQGTAAVCAFVNDQLDRQVLELLAAAGIRHVALRSAGFNHVDLEVARALGVTVARVPAYSPHAVAEHAVALILALNRKIPRAHARVRDGNFSLDGLLGFDLHGSTVGIVGTGRIGQVVAQIMLGFGCRVLAYDPQPNEACRRQGVEYLPLPALLAQSRSNVCQSSSAFCICNNASR